MAIPHGRGTPGVCPAQGLTLHRSVGGPPGKPQNPSGGVRIDKTISRVDSENGKGLIHRVTVTDVGGLSKTVVTEMTPFLDCLRSKLPVLVRLLPLA